MQDDGTLSSWFKENYFEKNNEKEALREFFRLSEEDLDRMDVKNKKKKGSTGPFA